MASGIERYSLDLLQAATNLEARCGVCTMTVSAGNLQTCANHKLNFIILNIAYGSLTRTDKA